MQRFYQEIRKDKGLFAYGKKEVLDALERGAVEILLVSEDLREFTINVKCDQCNNEFKVESKENELIDQKCPECRGDSLELLESLDFVEELSRTCTEYGTTLELVSSDSEEAGFWWESSSSCSG